MLFPLAETVEMEYLDIRGLKPQAELLEKEGGIALCAA
jgi:hypothetical protein